MFFILSYCLSDSMSSSNILTIICTNGCIMNRKCWCQPKYKTLPIFSTITTKIILLSFIPIFALNSYLLFRKVGLNFAEHIILSGMAYLLIVCIFTMDNLLALLQYTIFSFVYSFYNKIALFILLFYMFYTFFQAFGDYYSRSSIILRTSIFLILVSFQILLLIIGIAMYLTAGTATIKSFQVHL